MVSQGFETTGLYPMDMHRPDLDLLCTPAKDDGEAMISRKQTGRGGDGIGK